MFSAAHFATYHHIQCHLRYNFVRVFDVSISFHSLGIWTTSASASWMYFLYVHYFRLLLVLYSISNLQQPICYHHASHLIKHVSSSIISNLERYSVFLTFFRINLFFSLECSIMETVKLCL